MNPQNQFSSEIAPGLECYHKGSVLFPGGDERMAEARQVIDELKLSDDDAHIEHIDGNIQVVLKRDVLR